MKRTLLLTAILIAGTAGLNAQGDLVAENTKLREALRNTTLSQRAAQEEAAIAVSAREQADAENTRLNQRLEEVMAARIKEQDDSTASINAMEKELAVLRDNSDALSVNLAKWKNAYEEAAKVARAKEAERIQAQTKAAALEVTAANYLRSNNELYQTSREILERYEKFSLGTALTAREPFVGTTRVKIQNLVQDFSDELDDERIKPE